jgi:hypothetical protein
MVDRSDFKSVLASYERAISANEKAGVTSRMFLNQIVKQPSAQKLKARTKASPVARNRVSAGAQTEKSNRPRPASSSNRATPHKSASIASLSDLSLSASKSRFSRPESTNRFRSSAPLQANMMAPSKLEKRLMQQRPTLSNRLGTSDATLTTADTTKVEDDGEDDVWSLADGNFGLDEASDDECETSKCSSLSCSQNSSFSSFTNGKVYSIAHAKPMQGSQSIRENSAEVPSGLRTFHRSGSSRSLKATDDDQGPDSFKVVLHRDRNVVDDAASAGSGGSRTARYSNASPSKGTSETGVFFGPAWRKPTPAEASTGARKRNEGLSSDCTLLKDKLESISSHSQRSHVSMTPRIRPSTVSREASLRSMSSNERLDATSNHSRRSSVSKTSDIQSSSLSKEVFSKTTSKGDGLDSMLRGSNQSNTSRGIGISPTVRA